MLILGPTLAFVGMVIVGEVVLALFLPWWLNACLLVAAVYMVMGVLVFFGVLSGPVVFESRWQLFWQSLFVVFGWPWIIWGNG